MRPPGNAGVRGNPVPWIVALVIVVGALTPLATASPELTVVDAPDVVVANDPRTMADDPETDKREFDPDYVFSAAVRVDNDEDQRRIRFESIVYPDPDVEDCPRDKQAFPVGFVFKRANLSAGESRVVGGSTDGEDAQQDPESYWPMALARNYRDGRTGENVTIGEGPRTFCAAIRSSGEDPACPKASNRTCVVATASFESYVRERNEAPWIQSASVNPSNPRPGQTFLLEAEAADNSTEPTEDQLSYTWHVGGETESGRTVQSSFATENVHEVRLEVSDGFDTVNRTVQVPVGDVDLPSDDDESASPGVGWLAAGVAVVAAAALRRR